MKKFFIAMACTMTLFVTVARAADGNPSEEKTKYVVGLPLVEEMADSSITKLLGDIVKTVALKMGIDTETRIIRYKHGDNVTKIVVAEMEAGRIDISYLLGMQYVEYLASGKNSLRPLFVISMAEKTLASTCLYARKGEFKDVSDLRGKRWAGAGLLATRYHLYSLGIDEPLDEFFGSIAYKSDTPITTITEGLSNDEYDVFSAYDYYVSVAGLDTKKDIPFEPLHCIEAEHTNIFVARKGLPRDDLKRYREIMLRSYKDPDFAKFQFAFKMIKGKFLPLDSEKISVLKKIYALAQKNGWIEEEQEFWKKYIPESPESKE